MMPHRTNSRAVPKTSRLISFASLPSPLEWPFTGEAEGDTAPAGVLSSSSPSSSVSVSVSEAVGVRRPPVPFFPR